MDSHPYQRNQMPFLHYYHLSYEPIHPQMKMDPHPLKSSIVYGQSWPPYATTYTYLTLVQFYCGHNNFPNYYGSKLPYPHVPTPSPMYHLRNCLAYPNPYIIPYTPPPYYTMKIPRYKYDKYMPKEY